MLFFSFLLSSSPSPLSERLEQGAQDQTIEPTTLQTNDLPTEIARPLSPSQRLSLGIPGKTAIIEKIESAWGTMGRGKSRALSCSFSSASPLIQGGPAGPVMFQCGVKGSRYLQDALSINDVLSYFNDTHWSSQQFISTIIHKT